MASTTHSENEHHSQHASPIVYHITFGVLLLLMGATIAFGHISLGPLANNVIAMAIAVTKATLVVLLFMQVKYNSRLTWVWASVGFLWLFLMFGILGDYTTRTWLQAHGW